MNSSRALGAREDAAAAACVARPTERPSVATARRREGSPPIRGIELSEQEGGLCTKAVKVSGSSPVGLLYIIRLRFLPLYRIRIRLYFIYIFLIIFIIFVTVTCYLLVTVLLLAVLLQY